MDNGAGSNVLVILGDFYIWRETSLTRCSEVAIVVFGDWQMVVFFGLGMPIVRFRLLGVEVEGLGVIKWSVDSMSG